MQTTKHGNSSITTYANQTNTFVNNLDMDSKPVDNDDLIDLILNSVSPVYESVVNSIQSRESPIALYDVVAFLLIVETHQEDYFHCF